MQTRSAAAMILCLTTANAEAGGPLQRLKSMTARLGGYASTAVAIDSSGAVYAPEGSLGKGDGTIVQLTPPAQGQPTWASRVIWAFDGTHGASPSGQLLADGKGGFYGTTFGGGAKGFGTVFEIDPSNKPGKWRLQVLWNFSGYRDGGEPFCGVAMDAAGALYGSTTLGGGGTLDPHPFGVVFKLTPPAQQGGKWTHQTLVAFTGPNGFAPYSTPLISEAGTLYGTTSGGGKYNQGTVYQVTPPTRGGTKWTHKVIYSFADTGDGSSPFSSVVEDSQGNLYGTTYGTPLNNTYGNAYRLSPPANGGTRWTEFSLWTFGAKGGGLIPVAGLTPQADATFVGATVGGGKHGHGEIFKLAPPAQGNSNWTETDVADFTNGDGENPMGTLVPGPGGNLFGTTFVGGGHQIGTVYSVSP
jgi:uncharacterized repeat protein (TIGR03803 family)